tara:strand:+ start:203 stop:1144 length:942 start_codon:yes stop_codon:yes gene_type:complete
MSCDSNEKTCDSAYDIFTTMAQSGNTNYLGVENRKHGLANNEAETLVDDTIQVRFCYLSNVSVKCTRDYPTHIYNFDPIELSMTDFRTLFFRPVTNDFHLSRQNYSNIAYCIPRQTFADTSGSKQFSFVNGVSTAWSEKNNENASKLPTIQQIQLIKAGQKFVSLSALQGCVSGLTFDELIHEWIEYHPKTNTMNAVIECYIQYDPLQVSVRCFFNYSVTIPGASYGQDPLKYPANILSSLLNNTMVVTNTLNNDSNPTKAFDSINDTRKKSKNSKNIGYSSSSYASGASCSSVMSDGNTTDCDDDSDTDFKE